jgi:hypothetical protein
MELDNLVVLDGQVVTSTFQMSDLNEKKKYLKGIFFKVLMFFNVPA